MCAGQTQCGHPSESRTIPLLQGATQRLGVHVREVGGRVVVGAGAIVEICDKTEMKKGTRWFIT